MAGSLTFPWQEPIPPGVRISRWFNCWCRGGVDSYSMGLASAARRVVAPFEISKQRVWLAGLPDSFRGFRIVQVSDIHLGMFLSMESFQQTIEKINALEPDIVAVTGDYVTYSRAYIRPVARALSRLKARHGVYAVLGNHDFRVDPDEVADALSRQGIEVLRNRSVTIQRSETLHLAGVDDWGYGADLEQALREVPSGAPAILLAHNPRIIRAAAARGISLVLSGHTHGGQVKLPVLDKIKGTARRPRRFHAGLDRLQRTHIYVIRGLGTVVLPFRYRCPAEITQIELRPDKRSAAQPASASLVSGSALSSIESAHAVCSD